MLMLGPAVHHAQSPTRQNAKTYCLTEQKPLIWLSRENKEGSVLPEHSDVGCRNFFRWSLLYIASPLVDAKLPAIQSLIVPLYH